ncbi:hypothetical protein B1812_10015 [Methylocystis bryophila]|uniref:Uncharacterized protein n=2 Tax=Methylocystis bryophila TaxID=655015 RepID=A0A1W6MV12_9HYPH|nr:hypothetical protein B1812_10015 [Methylocystis bryophila]
MDIELALANLEAGKFSFRMVDAIKDRLEKLENEVTLLRSLHSEAMSDLRQQQLAAWRLESETTRLNAKIHALLKANALTEKASRAVAPLMSRAGESLQRLQQQAKPAAIGLLEKAIDGMASLAVRLVKLAHRAQDSSPATKIGESLEVLKKQAGASLEKTPSPLSVSGKNVA